MREQSNQPVVIVGYARTPIGDFKGLLSRFSATELGACAIRGALSRINRAGCPIDEVIMGCVLSAGIGQAPARQAAIAAGLSNSVGCTTVNKMCGSGLKAIMMGYDAIKAGSADVIVAGGMESMTNAPYLIPNARKGFHFGHMQIFDHLLKDGLEDPWQHRTMGSFAEDCAERYGLSRQIQDEYAKQSLSFARKAAQEGWFKREIEAVVDSNAPASVIAQDELPHTVDAEKITRLKPAFKKNGTITAANASSISDGAAAVVMMSAATAQRLDLKPSARIVATESYAQAPEWFTTAPVRAVKNLLNRVALNVKEVDLFEINEAFAVVPLVVMQELGITRDKLNIHGGACALGHPIGASGARIVVTLISALAQHNLINGIASLCIGGGEANAVAIERCQS